MRILVDIDGVVADFFTAWLKAHGLPPQECYHWPETLSYNLAEMFPIAESALWEPCDEQWWENLSLMPDACEIMNLIHSLKTPVYFLSRPVPSVGATGKLRWVAKNFPGMETETILTKHKHLLADGDTVLIDDQENNVDGFTQSGGRGILLSRPWNSRRAQSNQSVDDLALRLDNCYKAWRFETWELKGHKWS